MSGSLCAPPHTRRSPAEKRNWIETFSIAMSSRNRAARTAVCRLGALTSEKRSQKPKDDNVRVADPRRWEASMNVVFRCCELSWLSSKQRMFPNRSVVVLIGLLPELVLVVASDRRSTFPVVTVFISTDKRTCIHRHISNGDDGIGTRSSLHHWWRVLPYVRLPKPGAIGTLGLFWLWNSSFESSWQLKSHGTSLNLQIEVVLEILAS